MKEKVVLYNGRPVEKAHFRTFIYGVNGVSKLVNSWAEYENHMATGLWFDKKEDVPVKEKAPSRKKAGE